MVIHFDENGNCLCKRNGQMLTNDIDCVTCKLCVDKLVYRPPCICPRGWYIGDDGKWHMPYNGITKPKIYKKNLSKVNVA